MTNLRANIALLFSTVALSLSVWTTSQAYNNAGLALQQREQQLVQHYAPGVKQMCKDFGMTPPVDPKSIEEMLAPLMKMVTGVQQD
jgi:hypothetical protein